MNRREFLMAAAATGLAGCATGGDKKCCGGKSACCGKAKILFGACSGLKNANLLKAHGYDFIETGAAAAFIPTKSDEEWKKQKDFILGCGLPLRSCNGFLPGKFRLTGPNADFEPALKYAEIILRRADEVGTKTIVFGSGGARNVPGDICGPKDQKPLPEKGVEQYTDFCRQLAARISDLKVCVVIEPLRPNESNIINYVWQGLQIVEDVNSPRIQQLADLFHMKAQGIFVLMQCRKPFQLFRHDVFGVFVFVGPHLDFVRCRNQRYCFDRAERRILINAVIALEIPAHLVGIRLSRFHRGISVR
jgi:sugar phosphate isomerase/epimerase